MPLKEPAYSTTRWTLPPLVKWGRLPCKMRSAITLKIQIRRWYSLNPKLSMTTPCPVKLASPCNCTHITLSPNLQSSGEFFKSANCFARVLPRATGLMASGEIFNLDQIMKKSRELTEMRRVWKKRYFDGCGCSVIWKWRWSSWRKQSIILNELDAETGGGNIKHKEIPTQMTQHVAFCT